MRFIIHHFQVKKEFLLFENIIMYVAHNSSFLNSFYSPKTFSYNKMKEKLKKFAFFASLL